ncbi:MAG: AAA family ATPase [Pirellulales bacterium]
MKIARLDLRAFGPFTDLVIDLDAGHEGLHIIYGPNEAGKTSMLRALKQFLYGISARTPDDFLHPYASLRIAAALRGGDGSLLKCVRRKAAKNDLRDADDDAVLEPALVERYLGGLDRSAFDCMFGIDHQALVEGGRAIVQGGGDLGQTLFAAGSGIARLRTVQQALQTECEKLFKPGGSTPRINKSLAEWQQARRTVRESQLPSAEWVGHDKALDHARRRLRELETKLAADNAEKGRLERIRDALPRLAEWKAIRAQLADLAHVRLLSEQFSQRRQEAVAQWIVARSAAQRADESIRDLDARLERIGPVESPVELSAEIEQLQQDLGAYKKAQRDLRTIVADCDALESEARRLLRELRPELPLEAAGSVRLTKQQQIEIQNLGSRQEALAGSRRQAQAEFDEASELLRLARQRLDGLGPPLDVRPLAAALRRAHGQGPLDDDLAAARAGLLEAEQQTAALLARLPLWSGPVEQLVQAPVPAVETIDRFDAQLSEAKLCLADLAARIDRARTRLADDERRLNQLRMSGAVPTEAALADARHRRDEGWRLVRELWQSGQADSTEGWAYAADANAGDLAEAYEAAVRASDDLADRLRREADRVASLANLESARQASLDEIARLAAEQAHAESELNRLEAQWSSLWKPIGVDCLPPREMRGWHSVRQEIVQRAEAAAAQSAQCRSLEERLAAARAELGRCLENLGQLPADPDESLAAIAERGLQLVDRAQAVAADRSQLTGEIRGLEARREKWQKILDDAGRQLAQWTARWAAALEPLGLPADATAKQANAVLASLDGLFEKLDAAQTYQARIAGIGRDAEQFRHSVDELARGVGPAGLSRQHAAHDEPAGPPHEAAQLLIDRYRRATEARIQRETLLRERGQLADQHAMARQAIEQSQGMLAALCQEAGCEDHKVLPGLERLSDQVRQLEREAAALERELLRLGGGVSLEELIRSIEQSDASQLDERIAQLERRIEQDRLEYDQQNRTIAIEAEVLRKMDSRPAAADAAEQEQSLRARIEGHVDEYARLRLASAVLRKAIERYRDNNQGPIIKRAGELFAELTAGSFADLRADFNDRGDPVLMAVRAPLNAPGPAAIGVEAMSEGTADQLYLALRLAGIETFLDRNEPIPFIVDDILIKFDNDRSVATLRALARLSRRAQVIFFTHHQHLVELAQSNLPPDVLFVHRLDALLPTSATTGRTRRAASEKQCPLLPSDF